MLANASTNLRYILTVKKKDMRKSVIIGLLLLTAGLFGVATTLNIIISHAMAQDYEENYYGDDNYSQYPTDDKKYECRTGPFEGFFVSSVEFCKHIKFDDNNDVGDGNGIGVQFCILESLEGLLSTTC